MTTIAQLGGTIVLIRPNGNDIQYVVDGTTTDITSWPVTIENTSPTSGTVKVLFYSKITLRDSDQYFICGSDNIQFGSETLNEDGSTPEIVLYQIINYPGLIKNVSSDGSPGYKNIRICNLSVRGTNTSIISFSPSGNYGGALAQANFSTANANPNNIIVNCSVLGINAPDNGGILVGAGASNLTIDTCYVRGNIGSYAGGIVGSESLSIIIYNSISDPSSIDDSGGGIVGSGANSINVTNCATINGTIDTNAGGIFGRDAYICTATHCYSTGDIGDYGGGIFGRGADTCAATDCYSTGSIGTYAAAIFAAYVKDSTANNCYALYPILPQTYGFITNTYAYNCKNASDGTWSNSDASSVLQGVDSTSTPNAWFTQGPNKGYVSYFGWSPYTLITFSGGLVQKQYTFTIEAGGSTTGAVYTSIYDLTRSAYAIQIQSTPESTITIDELTGIIHTTQNTPAGTYTLIIRSSGASPEIITKVRLIVTSGPPPPPTPSQSGSVINAVSRSRGSAPDIVTSLRGAFTVLASQNPTKKKATKYASYNEILALKKAVNTPK